MNDRQAKWVPTEEELVSLGFEMTVTDWRMWYLDCNNNRVVEFSERHSTFYVASDGWVRLFPKSLQELRSLISMMTP